MTSTLHISGGCVEFLKKMAGELGLPVVVYEFVPNKPVVVMTWVGEQPDEPSILLNSHIDVVPVNEVSLRRIHHFLAVRIN